MRSLGFIAETEHQVVRHLQDHLRRLPAKEVKSRAIVQQMQADEREHATQTMEAGAVEFPALVRRAMQYTARVMTGTAYRL